MKPETVQLARDLMRHTLHGPPPIATTMALAEAVIAGDADLAALRIEHEAVCGLLAHTRKDRDEARTTISGYEAECAEIDQVLGRALGYPLAPGSEVTVCTSEHTPVSLAVDAATRLEKAERERDELRAALLNERGEGEPPSEGWEWIQTQHQHGVWVRDHMGTMVQRTTSGVWYWTSVIHGFSPDKIRDTAREAMRAADTALAGSRS